MNANAACSVLVIDDDQTILKLCSAGLRRSGYEVATAASGEEGLRLALERPVDVVVLDINLPDLSGLEVMRRIVKATSAIVILITGDDYRLHKAALEEGAADVVSKPFRLSELCRRIEAARQRRAETGRRGAAREPALSATI